MTRLITVSVTAKPVRLRLCVFFRQFPALDSISRLYSPGESPTE